MANGADGLRIALTEASSTLNGHKVGETHVDSNGYEYRLVLADPTLIGSATAAGQVIVVKTAATWVVTNDVSDGLDATYPICAGIAMGAATASQYFWVMRKGYYATVSDNGDDDIAAGDYLFADAANDCDCDSLPGTATNTADGVLLNVFGIATAADVDAANTVAAFINCRV